MNRVERLVYFQEQEKEAMRSILEGYDKLCRALQQHVDFLEAQPEKKKLEEALRSFTRKQRDLHSLLERLEKSVDEPTSTEIRAAREVVEDSLRELAPSS